jgi:hypothetical protein
MSGKRRSRQFDPGRRLSHWSLIRRDLIDVARFAREAKVGAGNNATVQAACYRASVVSYGRCCTVSDGGRPKLGKKHVRDHAAELAEVHIWIMHQRDRYVTHDEKPDQYAKSGFSLHNGSLIGGTLLAYFVSPPDDQLERMARLAETLIEQLVSPEIARLRNLAMTATKRATAP